MAHDLILSICHAHIARNKLKARHQGDNENMTSQVNSARWMSHTGVDIIMGIDINIGMHMDNRNMVNLEPQVGHMVMDICPIYDYMCLPLFNSVIIFTCLYFQKLYNDHP